MPRLNSILLKGILLILPAMGDDHVYSRQVRPILSEHCFPCHGPQRQEAELRLDLTDFSDNPAVSGSESELIRRVLTNDADLQMPPPAAKRPLSTTQKNILRQWSANGAAARRHWAFLPINPPQIPTTADSQANNSIDQLVFSRLHDNGMSPAPQADADTLLRRASLALTGLPPDIKLQQKFEADSSEDAWKDIVNQLLESPSFGEQMAAQWMDVARFADTFGYDNDAPNRMWPWRDWVIRAFNENLPYDDFIRWQVAGDMLPNATTDQILATAFHRLHRQNAEGGVIPEEFVVEYRMDRVQTFATAFLGLTLECARCHDHKFDPLSQTDFYSLYALFGNIDELGTYAEKTAATPTPNLILFEGDQQSELEALRKQQHKVQKELTRIHTADSEALQNWISDTPKIRVPTPTVHLSFHDRSGVPATARLIDGPQGPALEFDGDEPMNIKEAGKFSRSSPFSIAFWLKPPASLQDAPPEMTLFHNSKPIWEAGNRGVQIELLSSGQIQVTLCHFWPGNAIRVATRKSVTPDDWSHIVVTWDGSGAAAGVCLYIGGKHQKLNTIRDTLECEIKDDTFTPQLAARRSRSGLKNGSMDEFRIWSLALSQVEVTEVWSADSSVPTDHSPDALRQHYFARIDALAAEKTKELSSLRNRETQLLTAVRRIMVMKEHKARPEAHVLNRGRYDQPGRLVKGGIPHAILPGDVGNRRQLADWMLRDDHPLVARVAVNRIWKTLWGFGLVSTPEDFGSQGSIPAHTELLDHLAWSFMQDNWDVKRFCRRILLSRTWRQASFVSEDQHRQDPENGLLARGPRYRLTAEQIRDSALLACGLLVNRIGGPSVHPPQPEGLWREVGPQKFSASKGEGRYRRSLYTFWKRTVPPPGMLIFDAVSREVCVARREVTRTSTQALALLNGPQFVEAARVLAGTAITQTESEDEALEFCCRRLLGRSLHAAELNELRAAWSEQQRLFANSPNQAQKLIGAGPAPGVDVDPVVHAAMTTVVQLLMNLAEFQELR